MPDQPQHAESGATFSRCGAWRYRLWRQWSPAVPVCLIGLNPSTADAHTDDPTIRRCIGFARRWGHGGLQMVNLYAFRSTDPRGLWAQPGPRRVGPGWAPAFWAAVRRADRVVACWGGFNKTTAAQRRAAAARAEVVLARLHARGVVVWHLGRTASGQPRHPLYLSQVRLRAPSFREGMKSVPLCFRVSAGSRCSS